MKYSAVILAGGKSSRMGQKKAELNLGGKSFIETIIDKLRGLGIEDIIISGYEYRIDGCRYVADIYKDKGPLAGIHAGLTASLCDDVLILTEDAPLVPADFIKELMSTHESGNVSITVAATEGVDGFRLQPLLGIYNKNLSPQCEDILQAEKPNVMKLIDRVGSTSVHFTGPELLVRGCNTPEEYKQISEME